MLTLAEVVTATCPDIAARQAWRSYLLRCLALDEIRAIAQGDQHPNYPEEALPVFRRIAQLRELHYKPQHLAAQIRMESNDPSLVHPVSGHAGYPETGQTAHPVSGHAAEPHQAPGESLMVLPRQAGELVQKLVEGVALQTAEVLAAKLLPPPEDRLIHADEASTLLACTPRSVGRLLSRAGVKPIRRGVWKRSQILRYIQQL
jgi:hypothetical protein